MLKMLKRWTIAAAKMADTALAATAFTLFFGCFAVLLVMGIAHMGQPITSMPQWGQWFGVGIMLGLPIYAVNMIRHQLAS